MTPKKVEPKEIKGNKSNCLVPVWLYNFIIQVVMEVPRRVTRCLNYKTGFSLIQKSGSLLVLPWQLILQSRVVSQNRDQQVWNHLMTPENSITIPWRFLLRPACRLWGLKVSVVCHVSVCDYPLLLFFCPPPLLAAKNKFYKVPVYYKTCLICT